MYKNNNNKKLKLLRMDHFPGPFFFSISFIFFYYKPFFFLFFALQVFTYLSCAYYEISVYDLRK